LVRVSPVSFELEAALKLARYLCRLVSQFPRNYNYLIMTK
jgi:hypothetical protein